jgi:hypothetical protein
MFIRRWTVPVDVLYEPRLVWKSKMISIRLIFRAQLYGNLIFPPLRGLKRIAQCGWASALWRRQELATQDNRAVKNSLQYISTLFRMNLI